MPNWFICTVDRAGVSDQQPAQDAPAYPTLLVLTDTAGTFQQTGFVNHDPAVGNQMLAVALAAVSTQRPVRTYADLPDDAHREPGFCYTLEVVVTAPAPGYQGW